MRKKGGLGRGLDALIPQTAPESSVGEQPSGGEVSTQSGMTALPTQDNVTGLVEIRVESIAPNPRQPRQEIRAEELDELAASLAEHGMLQPLIVTRLENEDGYSLIAGERRWR